MGRSNDPLVLGCVIGDILDPFTRSVSMRVVYNNKQEVMNSCDLKPSQIVNQPKVYIAGEDLKNLYYTLVH